LSLGRFKSPSTYMTVGSEWEVKAQMNETEEWIHLLMLSPSIRHVCCPIYVKASSLPQDSNMNVRKNPPKSIQNSTQHITKNQSHTLNINCKKPISYYFLSYNTSEKECEQMVWVKIRRPSHRTQITHLRSLNSNN
jgi:hypothetical protein